MRAIAPLVASIAAAATLACSSGGRDTGSSVPTYANVPEPTLATDVAPITQASQALAGVVIPPFQSCQAPRPGDTTPSPNGKVCTNVAVAGSTEAGKYFPDYASCDVVRTQRPYQSQPPAGASDPNDPRLQDSSFMTELAWVTSEVRATACTCCHDGTKAPQGAAEWDIQAPRIWTDSASDAAIALFSGYADSTILGHYQPGENNGFERTTTGLPSDDPARMLAFWNAELTRRGITQAQAAAIPPFGGPLIKEYRAAPQACDQGVGISATGAITWGGALARYVYVLPPSAPNPSLPPDGDLPPGILWRLDVLASAEALKTGLIYGTTPAGTFQRVPAAGRAHALERGTTYHLFVLEDIGLVLQNCLFTY